MDDRVFWLGTSWKMTKEPGAAAEFADRLARRWPGYTDRLQLFVLPGHTLLAQVADRLAGSPVLVGAQDVHPDAPGPHTGDVSVEMIKGAGAQLVEVGHSERRAGHGETDGDIRAKVAAALAGGLRALVCVGEPGPVRAAGAAVPHVTAQVLAACSGLSADQLDRVLVAYEPVWAIGEGATPATLDQLEPVHAAVLDTLRSVGARRPRVLYGGSVNPANAAELAASPVVHGLFVGRHAWSAGGFLDLADRVHAVVRPHTGPTDPMLAARARTQLRPRTPRRVSGPGWRRILGESGLVVGVAPGPRPAGAPGTLSNPRFSMVLESPQHGERVTQPPRGVALILDAPAVTDPTGCPGAVQRAARMGADGLLLRWADDDRTDRLAVARTLATHCHDHGLLLLAEPVPGPDADPASVAELVSAVADAGADLLVLPFPSGQALEDHGDPEDHGYPACRTLDAAAGPVPWILRQASRHDPAGTDHLAIACQAGASGVLLDHRGEDCPLDRTDLASATAGALGRPIVLSTGHPAS